MSSTPREVGTLIAVILKARNLPNKRHIGKQDPYCTIAFNGEKRRTKAIKRGGQHPEWDEEIRFTLYEDMSVEPITVNQDGTPPPPPPKKEDRGPVKIKGGKAMALACYAEDMREPDLIGETKVDLSEVLSKGETDEWFTLMNKEKYSGEVYLELTFWSNEPIPVKPLAPKPKPKKQYGGPGSFVPSGDPSTPPNGADGFYQTHPSASRLSSLSSLSDSTRDSLPASLRTSSSLAKVDLYVPPYETARSHLQAPSVDSLTNDFSEFGVNHNPNRRTSVPPSQAFRRSSSSIGFAEPQSSIQSRSSYGYDQGSYSDGGSSYGYDRPVTPTAPYREGSLSTEIVPYQAPYELSQTPHPPARRPRYSVPSSSSGFMPIPTPTPAPSGFQPMSSFHSLPSQATGQGFLPPSSSTPAPYGFGGPPQNTSTPGPIGYGPPPSRLPVPTSSFPQSSFPGPMMPSSSFSTIPPSLSSQPSVFFPQYGGPSYPPQQPQAQSQLPPPPSAVNNAAAPNLAQPVQNNVPPAQQQQQQSFAPPVQRQSQQQLFIPPPPPLTSSQHQYNGTNDQSAIYAPNASSPSRTQPSVSSLPTHDSPSPSHGQQPVSRPLPLPAATPVVHQHARRQSSLPIPPSGSAGTAFSPTNASAYGYPPSRMSPVPPPPNHNSGMPPSPAHATGYAASTPSSNIPAPPSQGTQQIHPVHINALPPPPPPPQTMVPYNSNAQSLPGPPPPLSYNNTRLPSSSFPPPPPPPQTGHQQQASAPGQSLVPPPPPPQTIVRRPSLPPPPPMAYQQQSSFQSLPPPPPPPSLPPHVQQDVVIAFPSANLSQVSYPGPLPRPPAQQLPPSQSYGYPVPGGNWQ